MAKTSQVLGVRDTHNLVPSHVSAIQMHQSYQTDDVEGLQQQSLRQQPSVVKTKKSNNFACLAIPAIVILCGILYFTSGTAPSATTADSSTTLLFSSNFVIPTENEIILTTPGQVMMQASNEYGVFGAKYPFFEEFPGSQLVEPFKASTIKLSGSLVSSGSFTFKWQIDGQDSVQSGTEATVTLTKTGLVPVSFHVYDTENGNYVSTYKTMLVSKYVKREIRSLTTDDQNRFLDAAHKVWELTTEDGQALYGDKFTGIHTFVKEHATASEDIMCDQFHEGSGFLTHHLALGNSFEAALRSVDPSVTLPYWDFSREGQIIADAGETPSYLMKVTPVFSHQWFGEVDEDSHIKNSRWAHSLMPRASEVELSSGSPHNSYGYFRSYWNNNPDSEVVRHLFDVCGQEDTQKTIATCQDHYNVLNTATLGDFQTLSPTDGHGPLHVQLGGVFGGCSDSYAKFLDKWSSYLDETLTEEDVDATGQNGKEFINKWGSTGQRRTMLTKTILSEYYRIYRGLWRSHTCAVDGTSALLECPTGCTDDQSFEECGCGVPKLAKGETNWQNLLPCVVFSEENQAYFTKTMSDDFMSDLTTLIASSSVKEGEMLHSGSPADILFWMVHPIIERMLAAKRLNSVTKMGGVSFSKWVDMDSTSDNWLSYSNYNLEDGENLFHPTAYTCKGHAADDAVLPDKLPFTTTVQQRADTNGDGVVSNWEFYLALDPNNVEANDYVFDNFDWSHCDGKITV